MALPKINMADPKNQALVQAIAQQVFAMLPPQGQQAVDLACDARRGNGAAGNPIMAQNGNFNLPVPYTGAASPAAGNGGSCGCNGGGSSSTSTSTPAGIPPTYPGGGACSVPMTPMSQSQQGLWNCQTVGLDLAPCDVARIQKQRHLVTFQGTLEGPLSAGDLVAVEIARIRVAHSLCIDELEIYTISDDDPPVKTIIDLGEVRIQPETVVSTGSGSWVHAWEDWTSDRPSYLATTPGRCGCTELCVCVPAEAHVRVFFELPDDVEEGDTLHVKFWGRRKDWQKTCGPCPVCDQCDRELLTPAEIAATTDTIYVID